jgi:hypothetical protein
MTAVHSEASTRFDLTEAGRDALAIDDAIQHRLDAEALDAIAALLRTGGIAALSRTAISDHVAATRRSVRGGSGQFE